VNRPPGDPGTRTSGTPEVRARYLNFEVAARGMGAIYLLGLSVCAVVLFVRAPAVLAAVTDLSGEGVLSFQPLINHRQSAILGVGAIEKRPKVMTLEDGSDVIVPRMMTMLSISYDHRVVDGADADRFMSDLKEELQSFPENGV